MKLVSSNDAIEHLRRVLITFKDGSEVIAQNVTDVSTEEYLLQLDQYGGDYIIVPYDDNVKYIQVLVQNEDDSE